MSTAPTTEAADDMITIPWGRGSQTFNRDHLQTAYLYFLEALDAGFSRMAATKETAFRLGSDSEIPATSKIVLAVGARICHEQGIEP